MARVINSKRDFDIHVVPWREEIERPSSMSSNEFETAGSKGNTERGNDATNDNHNTRDINIHECKRRSVICKLVAAWVRNRETIRSKLI